MPAMEMVHEEDPAQVIFRSIGMKKPGELPGFQLHGNRVLLGIYQRPEKTKGGILITERTRDEEKYQGKAALVLMKGPAAFVDDEHYKFLGDNVEVGDWVSLWVTDGRAIVINKVSCRLIRDQDIAMKIPAPDRVF